jgi:hypothetical protein
MFARYDVFLAGAVAEWLGRGLQSPVHRFESGPRLCSAAGLLRCEPPSRTGVVPVQKRASSEHRYMAAATRRAGPSVRRKGLQKRLLGDIPLVQVAPDHAPGDVDAAKASALTLILSLPASIAAALVRSLTPPFEAVIRTTLSAKENTRVTPIPAAAAKLRRRRGPRAWRGSAPAARGGRLRGTPRPPRLRRGAARRYGSGAPGCRSPRRPA